MRKYYLFFAVSGLIVLGIILATVIGNASLRHDFILENQVADMQTKLNQYVTNHKALPKVPLDAGISDTHGIDYKIIDESRYMLCADYHSKSDGYRPPSQLVLNGVEDQVASGALSVAKDTHYSDGSLGNAHEKGYSCLIYSPIELDVAYLKPYQLCKKDRYKSLLGNQEVVSVDTGKQTLALHQYVYGGATTGSLTVQNSPGASINTYTPSTTYTLADGAKIYSVNCEKINLSDIKPGNRLNVYQDEYASHVIQAIQLETVIPN